MYDGITLRPVQPGDEGFLYLVYASTRADELAPLNWSEQQRHAFLTMQFDAQSRFYREQFPGAAFQVILRGGVAIGRLYVDRRADEISIIDIALVPEQRGHGIGAALLTDLIEEADRADKPVRIHVERFNPALRLYQRLGFVPIGDTGVYLLLEKLPAALGARIPDFV